VALRLRIEGLRLRVYDAGLRFKGSEIPKEV
jgi:hypothetical protein